MKKIILTLSLIISYFSVIGQDTIVMVDGGEIYCKVKEITQTVIQYHKTPNLNGVLYTMNLTDILFIKYPNGVRDLFNNEPKIHQPTKPKVVLGKAESLLSDAELYQQGQIDARKYYSKYSGAGTGTLLTSLLLNGLFGLIPAIPCSATPPKMKNLGYPSQQLMDNPSYCKGYMDAAKKKKQKKVWMNWGIGTIISTAVIVTAYAIQ